MFGAVAWMPLQYLMFSKATQQRVCFNNIHIYVHICLPKLCSVNMQRDRPVDEDIQPVGADRALFFWAVDARKPAREVLLGRQLSIQPHMLGPPVVPFLTFLDWEGSLVEKVPTIKSKPPNSALLPFLFLGGFPY